VQTKGYALMHFTDTEEATRAPFFNVQRLIRQIQFQLRASSGCVAKSFTPRSAFPQYDLRRDGKEYRTGALFGFGYL